MTKCYRFLLLGKVLDPYFTLWRNCHFSMRDYMLVLLFWSWSWCMHVRILFCRHLSPQTCGHIYWARLSLEDKRGLSLGELIRPFCIMFSCWYLSLLWLLFHFTVLFLCLFSLILQGLHEEEEYRQLEFWPESGAKLRYLFCATPNAVKINDNFFWIYKKY